MRICVMTPGNLSWVRTAVIFNGAGPFSFFLRAVLTAIEIDSQHPVANVPDQLNPRRGACAKCTAIRELAPPSSVWCPSCRRQGQLLEGDVHVLSFVSARCFAIRCCHPRIVVCGRPTIRIGTDSCSRSGSGVAG